MQVRVLPEAPTDSETDRGVVAAVRMLTKRGNHKCYRYKVGEIANSREWRLLIC